MPIERKPKYEPGDVVRVNEGYVRLVKAPINYYDDLHESPAVVIEVINKIKLKNEFNNSLGTYVYYLYKVFVAGKIIECHETELSET